MHISEQTLLDGALRRSKLILLAGMVSNARDVRSALEALRGEVVELDLRGAGEDPGQSIAAIESALADPRHRTLLLHIEPSPGPGALSVLSALAGRPADGNTAISIGEESRVVAFAGGEAATEAAASLFPIRISGIQILQELRERAIRADEQLREAQARARESSRLHGLR